MAMDLIISENGQVMIASNEPFAAEVTRVDFDALKCQLILNYMPGLGDEAHTLNLAVHNRMVAALMKAPSVLLVEVKGGQPIAGFGVPLTQTEFH